MTIKVDKSVTLVFDLDDTLYCEIDFLKSAYREIASALCPGGADNEYCNMLQTYLSGGNAFAYIADKYRDRNLTVQNLLYLYRNHFPSIYPRDGVIKMLSEIKKRNGMTGIITDGRSITQRNKIAALGIAPFIDTILVSEETGISKPAESPYLEFMSGQEPGSFYYFGDNPEKDFVAAKRLGWTTVGVEGCPRIHRNEVQDFPDEYRPEMLIRNYNEIEIV